MPNAKTPTEQWFENLTKLQSCMKNLNHLTASGLKKFSKQKLSDLILNDSIKGNVNVCCQNSGIGLVPNSAYNDMSKTFGFFLDLVGFIVIETSLRIQIYAIAIKHNPAMNQKSIAQVMQMKLDSVFGNEPLISNFGKKDLDFQLNDTTPDDFYPTDGSFLQDGDKKLGDLVKEIIS